ncbi:MAG: Ig-like domain-containing protein [Gemmatimonadales bacterium]
MGNPRALPPFRVSGVASPAPPAGIRILSGNAQRGGVGSALPAAIVLQTVDSFGNPVGDVPIRLAPSAGSVGDSLVRTGANGQATVRWTLGTVAGPARLEALLNGSSIGAEATATARPGAVATVVFVSPPTAGTAGQPFRKPIQVLVADRYGNGVPLAAVSFSPAAGKVSPLRATADEHGAAVTRWTLGPAAGKQILTALVPASKVRAVLTISAGPAKSAKPALAPKPSKPKTAPQPTQPLSPLGTPTR